MKQIKTRGIVLTRIDYGEADRIVTVLTPDQGKVALIAKGVRRIKSKMAAGIELFCVSEVSYIPKQSAGISRLLSIRLERYYDSIVTDIERTMLGYESIKLLNSVTEDQTEERYFLLLEELLEALDDKAVPASIVGAWFTAQLIEISGFMPNLSRDTSGAKLSEFERYDFNYDASAFTPRSDGRFGAPEIKYLRLLFGRYSPTQIARIQTYEENLKICAPLCLTLRRLHLGK